MVKLGNLESHKHAHNAISVKHLSLFVITNFTANRNAWNNSVQPWICFSSRSTGVPFSLVKDTKLVIYQKRSLINQHLLHEFTSVHSIVKEKNHLEAVRKILRKL